MSGLVGGYLTKIEEATGRIRLPAPLSSRIETKICLARVCWDGPEDLSSPGKNNPTITKTHFPFVEVYPENAIPGPLGEVAQSPLGDRESLWAMRDFSHPFREIAIDSANRITLSPDLRAHLGLIPGAEVLVLGMTDRFELWNPKDYEPARENFLKSE